MERAGRTLKRKFPLSSLWDGAPCGRIECITVCRELRRFLHVLENLWYTKTSARNATREQEERRK